MGTILGIGKEETVKVDTGLGGLHLAGESAKASEAAGYDGLWTAETAHDPFLPIALGSQTTSTAQLGTSIAVAFARNPMLLANLGWDLQALSNGRFMLGLGSQIKPHIQKRFSMEWSSPAARMREMVLAIRAIWDTWQNGTKLDFRGDFYTHTIMTPFFTPDAKELGDFGPPKIFLAGVGPLMTEVAGEVCDGFIAHGFTTERYLREVTIPALARGREKVGKTMEGFEISAPLFVTTGTNEEEMAKSLEGTKAQIAFYGSTPAYKRVLDLHGWGDIQPELNTMSKAGQWAEMGNLIDDDILDAFAVVREPAKVADELAARFGDVVQRLMFYAPYASDEAIWADSMATLKAAGTPA